MSQMQTCSVHTNICKQACRPTYPRAMSLAAQSFFCAAADWPEVHMKWRRSPSNSGASPRHAGSQQPPSGAEEAPRRIASGSRMRERPNSMMDTSVAPKIYTRGRSRCSESTCAHPTASSWLTAKKHRGRAGGPLPASCSLITSADQLVERRIQETHAAHARDG